ncbi:MAG: hypothetical protein ACOCY7_02790 [Halodesulfurarchaeum sp.]
MSETSDDRTRNLQSLGDRVAGTSHASLSEQTIDRVVAFVSDVDERLNREDVEGAAGDLLAFWAAYVGRKLDAARGDWESTVNATIERFELAFDEELIGVDLYEALETLAIVDDMPPEETDDERLELWTRRVRTLTKEFADHLADHRD